MKTQLDIVEKYKSMFLGWCTSYEQEEREMRELIKSKPEDEKMLRNEYEQLTGKRFRKSKKDEDDYENF